MAVDDDTPKMEVEIVPNFDTFDREVDRKQREAAATFGTERPAPGGFSGGRTPVSGPSRSELADSRLADAIDRQARVIEQRTRQSEDFNRWFAGSKIVDESGQPRLLFHGTQSAFDQVDFSRMSPKSLYGPGFYMTTSAQVAHGYATTGAENWGAAIMPFYSNAKNPFPIHGEISESQLTPLLQNARSSVGPNSGRLRLGLDRFEDAGPVHGEALFHYLTDTIGKIRANRLIERSGFDAITYQGGLNTGRGDYGHDVVVALRQDAIRSAFDRPTSLPFYERPPAFNVREMGEFGAERYARLPPREPKKPRAKRLSEDEPSEAEIIEIRARYEQVRAEKLAALQGGGTIEEEPRPLGRRKMGVLPSVEAAAFFPEEAAPEIAADRIARIKERAAALRHISEPYGPPKPEGFVGWHGPPNDTQYLRLFHGTRSDFSQFNPFSHFGTLEAAQDAVNNDPSSGTLPLRVLPVTLQSKKVAWFNDSGNNTADDIAESLLAHGEIDKGDLSSIRSSYSRRYGEPGVDKFGDPTNRRGIVEFAALRRVLRRKGIDTLAYKNDYEDSYGDDDEEKEPSVSYMNVFRSQVRSAITGGYFEGNRQQSMKEQFVPTGPQQGPLSLNRTAKWGPGDFFSYEARRGPEVVANVLGGYITDNYEKGIRQPIIGVDWLGVGTAPDTDLKDRSGVGRLGLRDTREIGGLLAREYPEATSLDYNRMGSTGGKAGRYVKVDLTSRRGEEGPAQFGPEPSQFSQGYEAYGPPAGPPPVHPGMTRMYHGGVPFEDVPSSRWVTPHYDSARAYAEKSAGGVVQYVDLPKSYSKLTKAFDDSGTSVTAPYNTFDLPEELARGLRPVTGAMPRVAEAMEAYSLSLHRASSSGEKEAIAHENLTENVVRATSGYQRLLPGSTAVAAEGPEAGLALYRGGAGGGGRQPPGRGWPPEGMPEDWRRGDIQRVQVRRRGGGEEEVIDAEWQAHGLASGRPPGEGGPPEFGPNDWGRNGRRRGGGGEGGEEGGGNQFIPFWHRFLLFEAVRGAVAFAGAERQQGIDEALALGDPTKLAMAGLVGRQRISSSLPFGLGMLANEIREGVDSLTGGATELSVLMPLEEAKIANARSEYYKEQSYRTRALEREATSSAYGSGTPRQRAEIESRRQAAYDEAAKNAARSQDADDSKSNVENLRIDELQKSLEGILAPEDNLEGGYVAPLSQTQQATVDSANAEIRSIRDGQNLRTRAREGAQKREKAIADAVAANNIAELHFQVGIAGEEIGARGAHARRERLRTPGILDARASLIEKQDTEWMSAAHVAPETLPALRHTQQEEMDALLKRDEFINNLKDWQTREMSVSASQAVRFRPFESTLQAMKTKLAAKMAAETDPRERGRMAFEGNDEIAVFKATTERERAAEVIDVIGQAHASEALLQRRPLAARMATIDSNFEAAMERIPKDNTTLRDAVLRKYTDDKKLAAQEYHDNRKLQTDALTNQEHVTGILATAYGPGARQKQLQAEIDNTIGQTRLRVEQRLFADKTDLPNADRERRIGINELGIIRANYLQGFRAEEGSLNRTALSSTQSGNPAEVLKSIDSGIQALRHDIGALVASD